MKVVYVSALAVLALVCVAAMAQAEQRWVEQRITNTSYWETGPKVWGDNIYYNDFRSGSADVYVWSQSQGSRPIIQASGTQVVDAVYQDRIVYRSYTQEAQGYADLYLWDPVGGSRPISTASGEQCYAQMYGDTIVWEDRRTDKPQIYIWDPINGERPISPNLGARQTNARIWGDTVVWQDGRNGRSDVYMWNPRDGERLLSTYESMISPAIYEDRVVMWALYDPYAPINDPGLWEWTPKGGLRWLFESYPWTFDDVMYTQLWGDMVVWQNGNPGSSVEAWDPVHGFSTISRSVPSRSGMQSIQGDKVAWIGNYDLYVSTLVPEPSGLFILAISGGFLVVCRRRRT